MKIGIIGDAKRALTWEKHLRTLSSIDEVVIVPKIQEIKNVDACILIDDTSSNCSSLLELIRRGYHTYLVSRLPSDIQELEKIYHASQEAGVHVQFSHWPSLAPSTLWLKQQVKKPDFIQILKEESRSDYRSSSIGFRDHWVDELAFIMNWMGAKINRIDPALLSIDEVPYGIQLFIKFTYGGSASLLYLSAGKDHAHRRIITGNNQLLDCNVSTQIVKVTKNENGYFHSTGKSFDASKTAEISIIQFLKSIHLNTQSLFDPFTALETAKTAEQIEHLLSRQ